LKNNHSLLQQELLHPKNHRHNSNYHANQAAYFLEKKQPQQALEHARKAYDNCQEQPQFLYHLGLIWLELNDLHQAARYFFKVITIDSQHYGAIVNLALIKIMLGELHNAETMLLKRNQTFPGEYDTLLNLAFCYEQQGQVDKAIAYYQKAAATNHKEKINAINSQLFLLHYQWGITAEKLYAQHCRFSEYQLNKDAFTFNMQEYMSQPKINIGYVSPDFKSHPVGSFMFPIVKYHNRQLFNIFCYSATEQMDQMTQIFQSFAFKWMDIRSLSNETICQAIQKDHIHILVDLTGYTKNNHIEIFAMKPAPIQVSYLGYPGTTGLSQIDYRITDQWADPPELESFYSEKLVRMPHCFLCYDPEYQSPDVADLPAKENGWISFGSFNRMPKLNDKILEIWAQILMHIHNSRLFLKTKAFNEPLIRKKIYNFFEKRGIEKKRLIVLDHLPSRYDHLSLYNQMDIALDTFPYHGTTTTCQALWMGVPVITLEGQPHVSRASVSILHAIGLQECIAKTPDEYIDKAIQLSGDIPFLSQLRHQLRDLIRSSPLHQSQKFVIELEGIYHRMWNKRKCV